MQQKYTELIEKELTRKDFLKFIGGGIFALVGLTNFISYLTHFQRPETARVTSENRNGFGSRKFGA